MSNSYYVSHGVLFGQCVVLFMFILRIYCSLYCCDLSMAIAAAFRVAIKSRGFGVWNVSVINSESSSGVVPRCFIPNKSSLGVVLVELWTVLLSAYSTCCSF